MDEQFVDLKTAIITSIEDVDQSEATSVHVGWDAVIKHCAKNNVSARRSVCCLVLCDLGARRGVCHLV